MDQSKIRIWYVEEFYGGKWQQDTFMITLEEARLQLAKRVKQFGDSLWRIRKAAATWNPDTAEIIVADN